MKVSKSIRNLHNSLKETAGFVESDTKELLEDYCKSRGWLFNFRCKEEISFAQKLETGMYSSKQSIDDFFGCEIVVPNLQEIIPAKQYIIDNFDVEYERPNQLRPASEFAFDGIRIYVKIKAGVAGKAHSWMIFEIQIKTLLEKAWGEATHDFTYKCKDILWAKERLVFQMKALLAHADIVLADAEEMSKSPLLDKQFDKYTKLNEISKWVYDNWNEADCPQNMKRLSETIYRLSKQYGTSFENIKSVVEEYIRTHGIVRNLSIYGTILQSLFEKGDADFLRKAKANYGKRCKDLKLIIPEEVYIEEELKNSLNKDRCVFLGSFS